MSGLRSGSLDKASKWIDLILRMCDELNKSINDAWKMDDLNDVMMGFGSSGDSKKGKKSAKTTSVETMKTGIKSIKRLLDESSQIEAMLEEQTSASRDIAKRTVEELERVHTELRGYKDRETGFVVTIKDLKSATDNQTHEIAELTEVNNALETKLVDSESQTNQLLIELKQAQAALKQATLDHERAMKTATDETRGTIDANNKSWQQKYQTLEVEYKEMEPQYKQVVESQRGRIRLLERDLAKKETVSHIDIEEVDRMNTLKLELRRFAEEMASLCQQKEELEEELKQSQTSEAELSEQLEILTVSSRELSATNWLQQQKLEEIEKGLVDAIGERKTAERALDETKQEHGQLETRIEILKGLIAQLFSICGAREVFLSRRTAENDLGIQVCERTKGLGATISGIKAGSVAEAVEGLEFGDVIIGVNGVATLSANFTDVAKLIVSNADSLELILVSAKRMEALETNHDDDSDDDNDDDDADADSDDDDDDGGAIRLAVLMDTRTARVGLSVGVEATLAHAGCEFYSAALQHSGDQGRIVQVDTANEACEVAFDGDVTEWLPLGSLIFMPNISHWQRWEQFRQENNDINSHANTDTDDDDTINSTIKQLTLKQFDNANHIDGNNDDNDNDNNDGDDDDDDGVATLISADLMKEISRAVANIHN